MAVPKKKLYIKHKQIRIKLQSFPLADEYNKINKKRLATFPTIKCKIVKTNCLCLQNSYCSEKCLKKALK